MNSPQLITTPIRHLSPALLGTKEEADAFASRMLRREVEHMEELQRLAYNAEMYDLKQRQADLANDEALETRVHHNTRPNRKTD